MLCDNLEGWGGEGGGRGLQDGGDATTLADSLRAAIATAMPQVGSDASAGVGQGVGEYDFSGDTGTAADNLEGAYRGSLQSQSPAQRMVPLCT